MTRQVDRGAAPKLRIRTVAAAFAAVFVLIGVLGFVPGITPGHLAVAGHASEAELFGLFRVSMLHNALHLVFGLVGLALARSVGGARLFLTVGGASYLALWLYGLLVGEESAANVLPVDGADNWLHLGLGLFMLAAGLLLSPVAGGSGTRLDQPIDRP